MPTAITGVARANPALSQNSAIIRGLLLQPVQPSVPVSSSAMPVVAPGHVDPVYTSVGETGIGLQAVPHYHVPPPRPIGQPPVIQPVRFDRDNINLPGEVFPHLRFRARAPLSSTVIPYSAYAYVNKDGPVGSIGVDCSTSLGGYLDADRFALLSPTHAPSGRRVHSRSDAWIHLWRHWGGRSVHGSSAIGGTKIFMPFVRCFEERTYQLNLIVLLGTHRQDQVTYAAVFPINSVSLYLIQFEDSFGRLPFIARSVFWPEDCGIEDRVRSNQRFFAGWHNFEIHDILPVHRSKVYAGVPDDWPSVSSFLAVPNPAFLSYHSRDWINGSPVERNNVRCVALSEFALY